MRICSNGIGGTVVGFSAGLLLLMLPASSLRGAELIRAFAFGSRLLDCPTASEPGTNYTMVHHAGNNAAAHNDLAYDDVRGWGYEVLYDPATSPYGNRNAAGQFGPFDDSPNNRGQFPDTCPDQLYDSFIGGKNFLSTCDSFPGNEDIPCGDDFGEDGLPEGIIFRVDVPDGLYRFVAVVGSADNAHSHRILAENGGAGPPEDITEEHVVLVNNFDQGGDADLDGLPDNDPNVPGQPLARVGFGCQPAPSGTPQFINMDEEGIATGAGPDQILGTADDDPPDSPMLEVTEGYIRIHQLQGRNAAGSDPNGGNMILLELWSVTGPDDGGSGIFIKATRSFDPGQDPDCYNPGEEITVTLDLSELRGATTVEETVPDGWEIIATGGGTRNGNTLTFNIAADGSISYRVRAPEGACTANTFSAFITPEGACESSLVSSPCCFPPECSVQASGGVANMLILGPIDLIDPADPAANVSANGPCNHADGLGDDFSTRDYLIDADGDIGEANILVEDGDEVGPDFGGLAGGFGVNMFGSNVSINLAGAQGILTTWLGQADDTGYINYNLDVNIGDTGNVVNDYIVFSLAYLNNTTGECLDAVLEVGSDDAVKVRFNGQLVHVNAICRGIGAYGGGDRIPVTFVPGKNVVLIGVVERGGGTGVRLVVRNPDDTPLNDGRIAADCIPPEGYPPTVSVSRTIDPGLLTAPDAGEVTVTLTAQDIVGQTLIADTFPTDMDVVSNGGGDVNGNTISFDINADGDSVYTLKLVDPAECPFRSGTFSGTVAPTGACQVAVSGDSSLGCITTCPSTPESDDAELVEAFIFQNSFIDCQVFNEPGTSYTVVEHIGGDPLSVAYPDEGVQLVVGVVFPDEARNYGFEILYQDFGSAFTGPLIVDDPNLDPPVHSARGGFEMFGPFDESPNGRNQFDDTCPDEIYDSFIGAKDWLAGQGSCTELINDPPDPNVPCAEGNLAPVDPDGIIFRVDVPNGRYKFVAAVGSADNTHAHRVLAEDGGSGPPTEISPNHVVLVDNFDQAQQDIGETGGDPGDGVFALVGFGDKRPPPGDGLPPSPQFVNMDADGMATVGCPDSPFLDVTQGYVRIHLLQANSNPGVGGARDPNGGDIVVLEIWNVEGCVPSEPDTEVTCDDGVDNDCDGDVDAEDDDCEVGGFVRGDSNADGSRNITDGVFIFSFLFTGGAEPPCKDAADTSDQGSINITSGIYILNFLFLGGPEPPAPFPDCGADPTPEATELGCESYPPCQ